MGFFNRDDDDQAEKQAAQQQPPPPQVAVENAAPEEAPHAGSYDSSSLAGIPASGRQRIERMKKDVERGFFTSDLSVNEFLLVTRGGLRSARTGHGQLDLPHRLPDRTGPRTRRWPS